MRHRLAASARRMPLVSHLHSTWSTPAESNHSTFIAIQLRERQHTTSIDSSLAPAAQHLTLEFTCPRHASDKPNEIREQ